jgi:hypothetical protein
VIAVFPFWLQWFLLVRIGFGARRRATLLGADDQLAFLIEQRADVWLPVFPVRGTARINIVVLVTFAAYFPFLNGVAVFYLPDGDTQVVQQRSGVLRY